MNFNVYKINKIFCDLISSLSHRRTYGFEYSGSWADSKYNKYFGVSLDLKNVNMYHWLCNSYSFYLNDYSYCYKIDHNHFLPWERDRFLYFLNDCKETQVSLRELILFMIYMRYLSSCI